eukprot:RCo051862
MWISVRQGKKRGLDDARSVSRISSLSLTLALNTPNSVSGWMPRALCFILFRFGLLYFFIILNDLCTQLMSFTAGARHRLFTFSPFCPLPFGAAENKWDRRV